MPLTLYKRGKIFHYRGTVDGVRLRGSTGTSQRQQPSVSSQKSKQSNGKVILMDRAPS